MIIRGMTRGIISRIEEFKDVNLITPRYKNYRTSKRNICNSAVCITQKPSTVDLKRKRKKKEETSFILLNKMKWGGGMGGGAI